MAKAYIRYVMKFRNIFKSKVPIGTIKVIIGAGNDLHKAPIVITENHCDAFELFKHLCLIFEECIFQLNLETLYKENPKHKEEMGDILNDVGEVLFKYVAGSIDYKANYFSIGDNVIESYDVPTQFIYSSTLYTQGDSYIIGSTNKYYMYFQSKNAKYIHLTVFALYNHLINRTITEYKDNVNEIIRIGAGIGTLLFKYENSLLMAPMSSLPSHKRGDIPNEVIEFMESREDSYFSRGLEIIEKDYGRSK